MESMTAQQVRDATLMLRRPTIVDSLQEKVPLPRGSVPRNGLPYWNKIPLSSKLPIIDHPKDAFVFYRDKLGKKLWRASPAKAFRLDDPYCRNVEYTYEALHDPHLANLHRAEVHRLLLRDQGLILPSLEAVCTLRDFNAYRRYLHSQHRECVREEYNRRAVDLSDEQTLRRARACEERQLEADRKRALREEKHGEMRAVLESARRQKLQQIATRQQHYLELLERVERSREEQRQQAVKHAREMDEKVRYRNAVAAEILRAKVIATIQAWSRDEEERRARLERQQLQLQEYKERHLEERWRAKVQCQLDRAEQEQRLLGRQEERIRLAVELRNKKLEGEDLRMQALLKRIKAQQDKQHAKKMRMRPALRVRGRPRAAEQSSRTRQRRRRTAPAACDITLSLERQVAKSLQIVRDFKQKDTEANINDLWGVIHRGEEADEEAEEDGVPEPVAQAMRFLLNKTMRQCIYKKVLSTLRTVYLKAMGRCRRLLDEIPQRELATRGWVCRHHLSRSQSQPAPGGTVKDHDGEDGHDVEVGPDGEVSRTDGSGQPRASASRRRSAKRVSDTERKKVQEQIEALSKKNEQLKKALEHSASTFGIAADAKTKEAQSDEMDIDANFEVMAKHLLRKIVTLASRSLRDETKCTTLHRWKLMKDVELSDLTDRLCVMMMDHTPREFLPSPEFHWAADILARDVMKEVRSQIRREQRYQERQRREQEEQRQQRQQPRQGGSDSPVPIQIQVPVHVQSPAGPAPTIQPTPEPLDESKVPLLRLHKRSSHQPSVPSLDSLP